MNLEPIDTSTTAGKAQVMRLAAEGREVAFRHEGEWKIPKGLSWDWSSYDYAIIAEPVGPDEVWFVYKASTPCMGPFEDGGMATEKAFAAGPDYKAVHYRRADLAGEVA